MCRSRFSRKIACAVVAVAQFLAAALLLGESRVYAQQLSIRHYDVSDGLAHSHVTAMHQDARGFLWLATWEGLSRFDGYRFISYSERDGLGDPIINAVAEDRNGHLWVGTNGGGVARLIDDPPASPSARSEGAPGARQKFISFRVSDSLASNRVNALTFDSQNNLWCATDNGLYRAATGQGTALNFDAIATQTTEMDAALADSRGRLWFGMQDGLIEIAQDRVIRFGRDDEVARYPIKSVLEDRKGRLLVANEHEVFNFIASPDGKDRGRWQRLPLEFKNDQGITSLLCDSAGALWVGTWKGLVKYREGKQSLYTSVEGLTDNLITSLAEDRNGNLWIGSVGGGVCKLSSEMIVSFTKTEGLPNQNVTKVIEDLSGHIYASVENGGVVRISGARAVPVRGSQEPPFSNFNERIFQDRHGDWWIGTDRGLFRFRGPELQMSRGRKFTAADGIPEMYIHGLYEDPEGIIWISPEQQGLYRFYQSGKLHGAFEHVSSKTIAPFSGALRMINDRSGAMWLGEHEMLGKLVNGRVEMLQPAEGLPETNPRFFFLDSRGWLWVGLRYKGVSMTTDPTAEIPTFVNYSTANGLASDTVWAITEDDFGRMYLGTGKGLDQLDLTSGRIRHFNTDDGLASDLINYCLKARDGNIWIATTLGLSKFNPHAEQAVDPPAPIYLSRVQIAGEELLLPETGARRLPELELSASRNNLFIEYLAPAFQGEHELQYQYKLEGVDADWSAPTEARSINYANLAAGSYQFLVRAINQEGMVSSEPAAFRFRILPPVWQRWWFLAIVAFLAALMIYVAHRARVARLVELERVRTRIATDLHDDIGANLSLVAMLSEVARDQLQRDDVRLTEWFSTIAATSRDTVDAMSDIVWAVNPRRDHLRDLTQRMRRFADDICSARDIQLHFHAPELGHDPKIGADLRREVFLIFKESINNMVRHSECTVATVDLRIEHGWLVLVITDNGTGCSTLSATQGHGLNSMRLRAEKLGGTLKVDSGDGTGTSVTLEVPLDHHGWYQHRSNH